jgi:hypothetical protein
MVPRVVRVDAVSDPQCNVSMTLFDPAISHSHMSSLLLPVPPHLAMRCRRRQTSPLESSSCTEHPPRCTYTSLHLPCDAVSIVTDPVCRRSLPASTHTLPPHCARTPDTPYVSRIPPCLPLYDVHRTHSTLRYSLTPLDSLDSPFLKAMYITQPKVAGVGIVSFTGESRTRWVEICIRCVHLCECPKTHFTHRCSSAARKPTLPPPIPPSVSCIPLPI